MNDMEEQLWNYIDGICSADERARIAQLIATDGDWKQQYEELMQLHADFEAIELDEPPMAFTYNVMEQIRTQEASVPLKASINKRIILGIAAFFVLTILAVLVVALRDINWSSSNQGGIQLPVQVSTAKVQGFFSSPWMNGFLFFDVVLGLFLLDTWLRKRSVTNQGTL